MSPALAPTQHNEIATFEAIENRIDRTVDETLSLLCPTESLSPEQRRGIIARYAAVLEGNFIYWMTATLLSVKSEEARSIIVENLEEEVRDSHPHMMRRFALAADAMPGVADSMSVYEQLTDVRLFVGRLSGLKNLITMAYFEQFIQRFMSYLADLAARRGSTDMEYTDVHGVCDVAHSQELRRALAAEMPLHPAEGEACLFEGVGLLRQLNATIVHADAAATAAAD